jgi:FKBP-type peptidyl-prolyl cis-trans isomerase
MALLASGSCLFFFPNCPRVWTSKASSDVAPRCSVGSVGSVGSDGEQLVERVPRRTALLRAGYGAGLVAVAGAEIGECAAGEARAEFYELEGAGGVKARDVRLGTGASPRDGDRVEVHYYGRLAAKQGWRFDSTYDHKDFFGNPEPYVFTVGDGGVIGGMNAAVRSMREGGVRRVVIPPAQGYQDTRQGPVPPDFFDRQRLYTTIFNQTRLANGEGDTLGTLIFDIELLKVRKPQPP